MEKTIVKYPHEDIIKEYLKGEDIEILITASGTSNWQFYASLSNPKETIFSFPMFPVINKFRVKPKVEHTLPFRRFLRRDGNNGYLTIGVVNKVAPKETYVFEIAEIEKIEKSKEFVNWIDDDWIVYPHLPT